MICFAGFKPPAGPLAAETFCHSILAGASEFTFSSKARPGLEFFTKWMSRPAVSMRRVPPADVALGEFILMLLPAVGELVTIALHPPAFSLAAAAARSHAA